MPVSTCSAIAPDKVLNQFHNADFTMNPVSRKQTVAHHHPQRKISRQNHLPISCLPGPWQCLYSCLVGICSRQLRIFWSSQGPLEPYVMQYQAQEWPARAAFSWHDTSIRIPQAAAKFCKHCLRNYVPHRQDMEGLHEVDLHCHPYRACGGKAAVFTPPACQQCPHPAGH